MNNVIKCINIINKNNADGLILFNEANMHYLCGFSPSEGVILITKDGTAYHLADSRYIEKALSYSKNTGLIALEPEGLFIDKIKELCDKHLVKTLLFEDLTISLSQYNRLKEKLEGVTLKGLGDSLMRERNRKEAEEILYMKKANEIAERSFLELLNHVKEGKTEKELAAYFDYLMAKNGSDGPSFDTILLSGKNTSMPHGTPGDKTIKKGEFVLFDFGATYMGYHSDMTRTVALGSADGEMQENYDLVLKAQTAGIRAFNEGVPCAEVYEAANSVLKEKEMDKYFRHGLGHGLGLEIHEGFNASPKSKDIYETGNVSSIEPGIYIPDKYGIRIEDVCYLSPRGRENLSCVTKELIEL
ncbi:MAG: aminopeptidase P family protein [Eubacterium sp.]|nr:aminopeptidase P family protein [Eubacterium sp.]